MNNMITFSILSITIATLAAPLNVAFAQSDELEFAAALEEALGHFRALELNLDEGNTQLAITHATHPIAELYDSIAPQLKAADPVLDARINTALSELSITASTDVPRGSAQDAVDGRQGPGGGGQDEGSGGRAERRDQLQAAPDEIAP